MLAIDRNSILDMLNNLVMIPSLSILSIFKPFYLYKPTVNVDTKETATSVIFLTLT